MFTNVLACDHVHDHVYDEPDESMRNACGNDSAASSCAHRVIGFVGIMVANTVANMFISIFASRT